MDAPSPQAQLDFLQNLQRLLGEGTFTATYKYALLLALADVCVERGEDTAATFQVQTAWLAEKFVAYGASNGHLTNLTPQLLRLESDHCYPR